MEIAYQLWFTVGRMHTEYAILLLDGTRSSKFPGQSFWLLTVAFQFHPARVNHFKVALFVSIGEKLFIFDGLNQFCEERGYQWQVLRKL